MNTFKEAVSLYIDRLFMIVVILLGFVLPIQLIHHFSLGNFAYIDWEHTPLLLKLTEAGLYLLEIWLVQLPFISLAQKGQGQKATQREVFHSVITHLVPVLAVGVLYTLAVLVGLTLLIIPGYILLILLLLFPQVTVVEGLTVRLGLKRAFNLGKVHFLQLSVLMLSFVLVETLLTLVLQYGLGSQTHLSMLLLIRLLLQSLLLPLFSFMVTLFYVEWSKVVSPEQILQERINDRIREVFSERQS